MDPVTVYIPCHNAAVFLPECVRALLGQTARPAEILVIDDGSTDRTREVAAGLSVRVIRLEGHPGLAAARNAAVAAAQFPLVASLDADCVPDPAWLETLAAARELSHAAGAGGRLVEGFRVSLADRWRTAHMRQDWGNARMLNPPFLFGCNTLFQKAALDAIGRYDTRFRTNGEDVDLSHRLLAAGRSLVYEPSAVVRHRKRDTALSVLHADWRWGYRSLGETMKYTRASHIVYHNYVTMRYHARQDIRAGRYSLLPLDLLLLPYHTHLDLRYSRERGLLKPARFRLSPRMETLTEFRAHLARLSRSHFLRNPDTVAGPPGDAKEDRP